MAEEIIRLRGLIKQAEWKNESIRCPWCTAYVDEGHDDDCPIRDIVK